MNWKIYSLVAIFCSVTFFGIGQEKIDRNISFDNDPSKGFSIYVPSGYDLNNPNKMMVGLHPFNTNRWDAVAWRDTLTAFAETNGLLLLCPDGGVDGRIDDQIDTSFTTFLIDSMLQWYNVDESKIFLMGFSWGGRTTYTYGLNTSRKFAGYMPIGAAMNGVNASSPYFMNANKKAFFVIHGSADSPVQRYFPFYGNLNDFGACAETEYMPGIGHTIDFPNRNQILTTAFQWLDAQNCEVSDLNEEVVSEEVLLFPNPIKQGAPLVLKTDLKINQVEIFSLSGNMIFSNENIETFQTADFPKGKYFIKIITEGGEVTKGFSIID